MPVQTPEFAAEQHYTRRRRGAGRLPLAYNRRIEGIRELVMDMPQPLTRLTRAAFIKPALAAADAAFGDL